MSKTNSVGLEEGCVLAFIGMIELAVLLAMIWFARWIVSLVK